MIPFGTYSTEYSLPDIESRIDIPSLYGCKICFSSGHLRCETIEYPLSLSYQFQSINKAVTESIFVFADQTSSPFL
jgi:hypothetical protein